MSYLTKAHKMDNFMDWASHMHVSLFIKTVLKKYTYACVFIH